MISKKFTTSTLHLCLVYFRWYPHAKNKIN